MPYDAVIGELLTRIKQLEEDVALLQQRVDALSFVDAQGNAEHGGEENGFDAATPYVRMTDEMIEICYRCGKKAHEGENPQELADEIVRETGMNRNSAIMYLYAVSGMLGGTIYKRAISAKATEKYFERIWNDNGSAGLKRAIKATRLHIAYRRECGHTVDSLENLCDRFERRL